MVVGLPVLWTVQRGLGANRPSDESPESALAAPGRRQLGFGPRLHRGHPLAEPGPPHGRYRRRVGGPIRIGLDRAGRGSTTGNTIFPRWSWAGPSPGTPSRRCTRATAERPAGNLRKEHHEQPDFDSGSRHNSDPDRDARCPVLGRRSRAGGHAAGPSRPWPKSAAQAHGRSGPRRPGPGRPGAAANRDCPTGSPRPQEVSLTPDDAGTWETLPTGRESVAAADSRSRSAFPEPGFLPVLAAVRRPAAGLSGRRYRPGPGLR